MKTKLLVLLFLVLGFLVFIGVRFIILDKTNEFGILRVSSSPTTSIFINSLAVGRTPFEEKYKTGEYLLKLIPEGTATETASWNGKINIFKNSKTFVNFELGSSDILSAGEIFTLQKSSSLTKNQYGEIYVETEPQGAVVSLDNDEKGTAPLILQDILPGDHELSVFMPGFFRRTQRINVNAGYRINAFFKLALDSSQKKLDEIEKISTSSASKESKKNIFVLIKNNPQGWLRVRSDASINATEEAKVKTGEKFEFLEEKNGWYKIKFNGNSQSLISGEFTEGWVSKEYASKEEQ
ncbi:MAG: PEGA domain-containing protein [Patescibacteria group bacterium]|nr:PEGA domain-containing protein [Patescibacteria group bacterium]